MTTLTQQLIMKMGLMKEPKIVEKTNEILRLLELKSVNVPLQINEYAKVIICADMAATLLCVPHDKENILKLSGLRKTQYFNYRRMFEKLLDVNKILTINDLCVQLSVNEMSAKAETLLQIYRKHSTAMITDDIMTHPQYVTMAVYMACKLHKKKISKSKCLTFSQLRPTQWQLFEQDWEKTLNNELYQRHIDEDKEQTIDNSVIHIKDSCKEDLHMEQTTLQMKETEPYEKWKQRILEMAWTNIQQENKFKN